MVRKVGLEPTTIRLTICRATIAPLPIIALSSELAPTQGFEPCRFSALRLTAGARRLAGSVGSVGCLYRETLAICSRARAWPTTSSEPRYPLGRPSMDGSQFPWCLPMPLGKGIRTVCLVGTAGFEPATPAIRMQCATRLRYTPTKHTVCLRRRFQGSVGS